MSAAGRPPMRRLRCGAVTALALLSGCAAQTQTAPVYRQSEVAAPAAAVREDFDPARFRDDLLLIDPLFPPPPVDVSALPPPPVATPADTAAVTVPRVEDAVPARRVYRVQVIALSKRESAQRVAAELTRRYDVPADVVPQAGLFAVRAGLFPSPMEAGELKGRIATLSQGYAGAFVVSDSLAAPADTAVLDSAAAAGGDRLGVDDALATPADGATADLGLDGVADSAGLDTDLPQTDLGTLSPEPELVRTRGWRVLIKNFETQEAAQDYRVRVMQRLRRDDVDVRFETPWFKVLAGSFRTQTEAQRFAERCRSLGYREAAKVPGEVMLPKEDRP